MTDEPEIKFFEEEGARVAIHDLDMDHPPDVPVDKKLPFQHIPTELEEK